MMNYFVFILALLFFQEVPFKPNEEFEIKLDYRFKLRPLPDHNTVELSNTRGDNDRRGNSSVLPYLILNIKLLKLPEEKMRMRVTTNRNEKAIFKKVEVNALVALDLGFTDDMKDRVTANIYTLTLVSKDKKPVEVIVIRVDEDGSFFVNGEKLGRF